MPQQPIDYTMRYQIRSGRVNFANYVQRRQLIQDGLLLGQNIAPPDNAWSIIPIIQDGQVNTTPAEYNQYLEEVAPKPSATTPPPPTSLTAVGGDAQVTIFFTQVSNGGSAITNYEFINLDASGAAYEPFAPPQTTSPVTITGLPNGALYHFQLRAVNAIGTSEPSDIVSATPCTVPDAPTDVSATAGTGEATVSFTAPINDGGSPITGYTVTSSPGGFTASGASSPITVTGLSGISYTFTVVATNIAGDSVASVPSNSVTPEIPVPSGTYYSSPSTNTGVTTVAASPFGGGGNSYSFDAYPDYLTVYADDSWAFGTGDFTIEWFQYETDTNSFPRIFSVGSYPDASIACSIEGGSFIAWFSNPDFFGNLTSYKNTWVHFAIVRQSNELKVYRDGTMLSSAIENTTDITNNSTILYFGIEDPSGADTQFLGNLTNIRIVKGLAVYTGDFTVPTSALTQIATANPYGGSNTVAIPAGFTKLLFVP
jgi:hypothetical protein